MAEFLKRSIDSIEKQTYTDYEIIFSKRGAMAENTNYGIKRAKGDIIKILFSDDYLAHENALQVIVDNFKGGWLATACMHDNGSEIGNHHYPRWNPEIYKGINTLGSPSAIAFENKDPLMFDEKLNWIIDCEWYMRMFDKYGNPSIINDVNVVIGIGDHQTTSTLPDEIKQKEVEYLINKYE